MTKTFLILVMKDGKVVKRIIKHGTKAAWKKVSKLYDEYKGNEYQIEVHECEHFF